MPEKLVFLYRISHAGSCLDLCENNMQEKGF